MPSPAAADLPPLAEQDVIRNALIYKPATVIPVGASKVLVGNAAFNNAREPLAQAFKIRGTGDADAFAVINNHFKSKGSGTPTPDGQGNATVDRVAQANGLLDFAAQFKAERGIERVFLVGDFNAYSEEDPVQEIERGVDNVAGNGDDYTALSDIDGTESYSFSGLSGSLDHVFANAAALADVTGRDVVDINASESVFNQYSRFNYNVTQLFDRNSIYALLRPQPGGHRDQPSEQRRRDPDPRHQRLPRSDRQRPDLGSSRCRRRWQVRSSSSGPTTPTRCSRPRVT